MQNASVTFFLTLLNVAVALAMLVGLVNLTRFSYNAKVNDADNMACVEDFSSSNLTYCKITTGLVWLHLILAFIIVVWAYSLMTTTA